MLDELKRIVQDEDGVQSTEFRWNEYVSKIISQAKLESSTRVSPVCKQLLLDEADGELLIMVVVQNIILIIIFN